MEGLLADFQQALDCIKIWLFTSLSVFTSRNGQTDPFVAPSVPTGSFHLLCPIGIKHNGLSKDTIAGPERLDNENFRLNKTDLSLKKLINFMKKRQKTKDI